MTPGWPGAFGNVQKPPPLFYRDCLCRIIISILINTVDLIGSFFHCCKRDRNALCTQKIVFFSELQE